MEQEKRQSKILIKAGSIVSGFGTITTAEAILTQHGELGPVGTLIIGAGAVLIFTGIRRKKLT